MDNTLSKYINKSLKGSVRDVQVVQGTSKEGNLYFCLELTLINGYRTRMFLKSAEEFAWTNAFDQLETTEQINANF